MAKTQEANEIIRKANDRNPLTQKQQEQAVFLHHALWDFSRDLSKFDATTLAMISELRNRMVDANYFKGISEDLYCSYVCKGGASLLADVAQSSR